MIDTSINMPRIENIHARIVMLNFTERKAERLNKFLMYLEKDKGKTSQKN
jgi:hypothetical protein